jgi:hypothetical protein
VKKDPRNAEWRNDLSSTLGRTAELHVHHRDPAAAAELVREALEIARELVARDPAYRETLAEALALTGEVRLGRADAAAAIVAYRESAELYERLATGSASRPKFRRALDQLRAKLAGAEMLVEGRVPTTPTEHFRLAEALAASRRYGASLEHYAAAFADAGGGAEADSSEGPPLYRAAEAAALASAQAEGAAAAAARARAIEWLREHLRLWRERTEALEAEARRDPTRAPAASRERRNLEAHSVFARTKDPDLASLRGTPEFEALFAK